MHPVLFIIGNFNFYTITLFLILAVIFGLFVFWRNARLDDYEEEKIFDLFLASLVAGLFGGRLFHFLIDPTSLRENLLSFFYYQKVSGFSFWGSIIASALILYGLTRVFRLPFLKTLDYASLGLALGGIFLSLGLFFDGRGFGQETQSFLGVAVPVLLGKRHPTSIYYLVGFLVIFLLTLRAQKRIHHPGFLIFLFLSLYSLMVAVIESKEESGVYWLGWGANQVMAILTFFFLLGSWYKIAKRSVQNDLRQGWLLVSNFGKILGGVLGSREERQNSSKKVWESAKSLVLWFRGPWW